ncbi:MAG: HD-GYP domain-containing protein [Oscillospiraceae bacterium]|nr:HD-GYP domain-containing protein [Oscillospiraceae bacterium]
MRFVPLNCIRDGSHLAKTIYGANGEVLLRGGTELSSPYIRRLSRIGLQGVYIADDLSEDIEIANLMSEELRVKVLKSIKGALSDAERGKPSKSNRNAHAMEELSMQIVDEILSKQSVVFNMIDIKTYDGYTFQHSVSVAVLSVLLGVSLGFKRAKLAKLAYSAIMHDIGKVFIEPKIINKPDKLSQEEYEVVKKHPANGYAYLRDHYGMTEISARGVYEHHERYDGCGYPRNKTGTHISEFGRIIAIADVFDALVSDRPYRNGLFAAEAMEYLMGNSGRLFDPVYINAFVRKVALFPVGTCVLLSNGAIGLVMENYENYNMRPLVKVFSVDDCRIEPYTLDLCHDFNCLNITVIASVDM